MHDHGIYPERNNTYKNGNVNHPQETTTNFYDYGMIPEPAKTRQTLPFTYNHRSYPERTTTYTYGYGLHQGLTPTTRYDHSMYPEERTKASKNGYGIYHEGKLTTLINGNDVHQDSTKISKNDLDNYLEMTTAYMYDDAQTASVYPEGGAFDESNNCSSLKPDPIGLLNATYVQGLKDCRNGTVIRKLLCSPPMTYNISLVNDVVPYFSDRCFPCNICPYNNTIMSRENCRSSLSNVDQTTYK
ncbi:Hypothetical predicted protein [Mytilus galloprovincialis]|uniref:Uncharacterized protein n=1 Tax=Mytilus galloprovincialis TaxID=29158 RepID=A0A8B6HB64_MYTGA|nr:Hypothetical predicted protein [Mytilus galloprovincialis]